MGQSWVAVNLDRREYFDGPDTEAMDVEAKARFAYGSGAALLLLTANPAPRDLSPSGLAGSWAGCRIVMLGDYSQPEQGGHVDQIEASLQEQGFKDVSADVFRLLAFVAGVGRPEQR